MRRGVRWRVAFAACVAGGLLQGGQGWPALAPRGAGSFPVVNLWGRAYPANQFSALCVGCHTENPSARILNLPGALPFGEPETDYRGSHFVRNRLDGSDHLTDATRAAQWEKLTAWIGSGEASRYGNNATFQSMTGASGEMLCESCHNVARNTGTAAMLLEEHDATTGAATLCTGCHAGFTGASHHPLGDITISLAGVRPPNDVAARIAETDGVRYFPSTATVKVTCLSCHKAHDAHRSTGARVLRRGASRVVGIPGILDRSVNVQYYGSPGAVLFRSTNGLHRQSDVDATGVVRLVTNRDPLCDTCHTYDD